MCLLDVFVSSRQFYELVALLFAFKFEFELGDTALYFLDFLLLVSDQLLLTVLTHLEPVLILLDKVDLEQIVFFESLEEVQKLVFGVKRVVAVVVRVRV